MWIVERNQDACGTVAQHPAKGIEFACDDGGSGSHGLDEHDPEGSTIAFERAQVVSLLADARRELDELAAATKRIDDGTYGKCACCGEAIAAERLDALPAATRCIDCSVRVDRQR